MKRQAQRIDGVVKSIIEKLDNNSNPYSEEIEKTWKDIAGGKAFAHSKPASLRKKRLVVSVDSSSWLYELTLRKGELLAKLKKKIGGDKVEELQFRIGEL